MNRKSNAIKNIIVYPIYYSHIAKGFITTDISNIKMYHKKEKKYALHFVIKFFIFSLLIWVLQYSNNWDFCRSWNYENNLKNVSILGTKRSLAENKDKITKKKGLKLCEQQDIITVNFQPYDEQSEIEQDIDVEQENEIQTKEKNGKVKFNERISDKCINNFKIISLILAFNISFASLTLTIVSLLGGNTISPDYVFILSNLSLIIYTIFLIYEKIKKKNKNK
ncbi:fam-h protein [Plasmodium relictum]|uniref:Fam-h protein n=1 Tax=Plasmodium relictum TaxID=85471 RepID=A0A1J1GKE7_PLARL|nr:fam-h protein [Plasmodium relictum]CRG84991.1 fam-h protein [Plasmodium relictum]